LSSDNLWTIAVVVALSSLLILTFFMLSPLTSKTGTVEQTKSGLDKAVNVFETFRKESKQETIPTNPSLKP
jgi:hypothetical protein